MEFALDDAEVTTFQAEVKSKLNGTLPVEIAFGRNDAEVKIVKKGPGGAALTSKSPKVAAFISERVEFVHIPAVRTAASAVAIVDQLLSRELRRLEADDAYKKAVQEIHRLQDPILQQLSKQVGGTLSSFLPAIKAVEIGISDERRYQALRNCQVTIDDGVSTLLEDKGDGVQSLVALGIMRHASEQSGLGVALILAIEEPESHLHPAAIHDLRAVLQEISATNQLVVTTHNPLFVKRGSIAHNIIVKDKKARPAKSIAEIRDTLGVRASDNLRNAELVLLVEGSDDKLAVSALLRESSESLSSCLDGGRVAIESIGGAGGLGYRVGIMRDALCEVHCLLDDDAAARQAFKKAKAQGLLLDREVHWATIAGMRESEFEDFYDIQWWAPLIRQKFGVLVPDALMKGRDKWSDRLSAAFKKLGKIWDESLEAEIKEFLAEAVPGAVTMAFHPKRRSSLDAFIAQLQERVAVKPAGVIEEQ